MITPTPYVKLSGGKVQGGLTHPEDWAGVVVSDIEVSWGREHVTEHEPPGHAKVKLMLKSRYVEWVQTPQGRSIEIGYNAPGSTVPLFHGRVEDGEIEYYDTRDGVHWYMGTFNAVSVLANLSRHLINGGNRAEETVASRRNFLRDEALATGHVTDVGGITGTDLQAIPHDYDGEGIYEAIQQVYSTLGEATAFDPEDRKLHADGVLTHHGPSPLLRLRRTPEGTVGITAQNQQYAGIKANTCQMTPLRLTQRQAIFAVKTMGTYRVIDVYGEEHTSKDYWRSDVLASRTHRQTGTNQQVNTLAQAIHTGGPIDYSGIDKAAALNKAFHVQETEFIHPPVTRRFPEGFPNTSLAHSTLGAHFRRSGTWIIGSVYNTMAEAPVLPRIIGGEIRFEDGVWETTHNLGSIATRPSDSLALSTLDATAGFTHADWDDSVTLADLALVEQGL